MPSFTCPMCDEDNEVDTEAMPDRACDAMDYECAHCNLEMTIGWFAEIEVRTVTVEAGELNSQN